MDRSVPAKKTEWAARRLEAADQDFLREMLYIALWDPPDEPRRPRSVLGNPVIQGLVEGWGRADDFALAAVDPESGELAGAIWTRLDRFDGLDDYGCPFPCLGIAVRPEFQSKGAGSFLMRELIAGVAGKTDGLRLCVHPKNETAIGLYRKCGFTKYATGAGDYLQMKRELGQEPKAKS